MRIYVVGMPAAGKTTLGRKWAAKLKFAFVDLDERIETKAGLTIPQLFAQGGEALFRVWEAKVLRQTADYQRVLITTGGGAPAFADNMAWMKTHGLTVFLDVPLPELVRRLLADASERPLFAHQDEATLIQTLQERYAQRLPFYQQAHLRVVPR